LKVDKPWGWKDEGSEVEMLEVGSGMLHKWLPSSQTYQVYASGGFEFVTSANSADDIAIGDTNNNDQVTVRGDLLLAGGVLILNAQSSAPVTCNSSRKGAMYFDTDINDACLCNGSNWVSVLRAGICG
jgi:hypothetical protein